MANLDNTGHPGFLDRKLTSPHHGKPPAVTQEDLERWGISKVNHDGNIIVRIPYPAFKAIAPASAHSFEAEKHLKSVLELAGIDASKRFRSQTDADFSVTFSQRKQKPRTDTIREDRAQFSTGAVRSKDVAGTTGAHAPRYDLITPVGLRRLAETYGEGAMKYGDHNWRKGIPISNLVNYALAHITAFLAGDRTEDHLAHASWNLFAIMHFEETRQLELFDLKTDDYQNR
jgi:hypothetical protein